jgi:hypothetical protein
MVNVLNTASKEIASNGINVKSAGKHIKKNIQKAHIVIAIWTDG